MRNCVILTLFVALACVCYVQGAAVQLVPDDKQSSTTADVLLGVDAGGRHSNAANRGTRQFGLGGFGYSPIYGGFGHRPYYGGYGYGGYPSYGYGGYPSYGYGGYGGGYGGYGGGYGIIG